MFPQTWRKSVHLDQIFIKTNKKSCQRNRYLKYRKTLVSGKSTKPIFLGRKLMAQFLLSSKKWGFKLCPQRESHSFMTVMRLWYRPFFPSELLWLQYQSAFFSLSKFASQPIESFQLRCTILLSIIRYLFVRQKFWCIIVLCAISKALIWWNWSPVLVFCKVHIFWEGHKILRNLHCRFE